MNHKETKNGNLLRNLVLILILWGIVSRWIGAKPEALVQSHDIGGNFEAVNDAHRDYQQVRQFMPGR